MEINLQEQDEGSLAPGEYAITLRLLDGLDREDVLTSECTVSAAAASATCSNPAGPTVFFTPVFGSPNAPHTQFTITLNDDPLPEQLNIEVLHDGVELLVDELAPDYSDQEGRCDDDCSFALVKYTFER